MSWLAQIRRRLRALVSRGRIAQDIDEEMRLHLDLRQRRLEQEGLSPSTAHTAARRRFGNPAQLREDSVDAWGWRWFDDLVQDVRYAVRGFARNKAFAATAVLSLALGIGANTAIFTVVNGVVLRPLPFTNPDRLVQLYGTSRLMPSRDNVSNLAEVRSRTTSFEQIAGYEVGARYMRHDDGVERVMTVRAERAFFDVLGVPPLIGRTFGPRDADGVAVVGEAFWRRVLQADPAVLGRTLTLDDRPYTIVGVMPGSFQFPYSAASLLPGAASQTRTDVWLPLEAALSARGRFSAVTGRLKSGVSLGAARSELAAVAQQIRAEIPAAATYGRGYELIPLSEAVVGMSVSRPLFLLLGAVAVVLALACGNVANLLLVRASLRHREVAVRTGLGAGSLRLVRQFLAESLLLSLAGGAGGLALAVWTTRRLLAAAGPHLPRGHEVAVDWRVFGFMFVLCTLAGVAVGLAPALSALRGDTRALLQGGDGRSTMTPAQRRVRDALVVAEVALAFVLAVGAALLVRELVRLQRTDLGMETRNVLTIHVGRRMVPRGREGPADSDIRHFYEMASRIETLPGVRAAGFTQMLPLQSWGWFSNSSEFFEVGRPPREPVFPIELRFVTPGYFGALGIRLQRGRGLADGDGHGMPTAIVINETLARRQFGGDDPVGKVMNRGTIVGIVADVHNVNPDRPALPEIYYAVAQNWSQVPELGMTLVVSTQGPPEGIADSIRAIARDVDPDSALFEVKTMESIVADSMSMFRLFLWLLTGFAGLAVVLAATGTYGVMSYVSASRAREYAVRMALGAGSARVAVSVLRRGLVLTIIGLACGLAGAVAAAPMVRNLPVNVRPPDAVTMAPIVVLIGLTALAACLLPALRASRVDPMSILRNE